jgi:hypothetical protein
LPTFAKEEMLDFNDRWGDGMAVRGERQSHPAVN